MRPNRWLVGLLMTALLCGCVVNPNANAYAQHRSFLGYDQFYEQRLINRYAAAHPHEVETYRRTNGW